MRTGPVISFKFKLFLLRLKIQNLNTMSYFIADEFESESLEPEKLLEIAQKVKDIGNDYFKKGDYLNASKKYSKV
jgi:hypothetical protein